MTNALGSILLAQLAALALGSVSEAPQDDRKEANVASCRVLHRPAIFILCALAAGPCVRASWTAKFVPLKDAQNSPFCSRARVRSADRAAGVRKGDGFHRKVAFHCARLKQGTSRIA